MSVVYRSDKTNLIIQLTSNEPLAILSTERVEDYNGIDGQISLLHVDTSQRYSVVMSPQPVETQGIDHDVFAGQKLLSLIPDGDYKIQGRVRDVVGNYTIIGGFANPQGDENTISLNFSVEGGKLIVRPYGLYVLDALKVSHIVDGLTLMYEMPKRKEAYVV